MKLRVLLVAAAATGIALRVWVLLSSQGALDGDEAVWGVMVQHIRGGDLPAFFWGQGYGGTQEAFLTVPLFVVFGPSVAALRVVPIALEAFAAFLVWRIGRRTIGEPRAQVSAALFWLWPAYGIWKSTRAHGFYGATLVLGLVVVLLALRLAERTSRRDLALLGLALGCGWWASPQILILAVPALVWLVARRPAVVRGWWLVVPAAVLGAAPWLVANLRHDWLSLHVIADAGGPGSRLHNLVVATLPTALGLRVPFSLHWVGSVWLGLVLYAIALVAVLAPGRGRVRPLLLTLAVFPFLYAVSPYASLNREPRYLDLLLPILALLLARWATRPTAAVAIVAVAAALSIAGLVAIERGNLSAPVVEGRPLPADIAPLLRTLQENHVTRVWANYWIAWRIDFESGEHIVAASTGTGGVHYERAGSRVVPVVESGRYPPYVEADRRAADAAFVFVATPPPPRLAGYRSIAAGAYVVELPRRASATSSKP